jgi:polyribonucleotide nucleotidyltransferase
MIKPIVKTIELSDGRTIKLETGKLAKQADGAVMLTLGKTMLLATVCAAKEAVPGTDFMPLQVEYREKFAAFGRFPGGFTKREGRASDYEILTCRLVDRALVLYSQLIIIAKFCKHYPFLCGWGRCS